MMFLANDPLNLSRAMILAPASQPVLSLKFVTHMVGVLLLENLEVGGVATVHCYGRDGRH